jgi:hypothetical protein
MDLITSAALALTLTVLAGSLLAATIAEQRP